MSSFDPQRRCRVHDRLNEKVFTWEPRWAPLYRKEARDHEPGVINWDGLQLDGWEPMLDPA